MDSTLLAGVIGGACTIVGSIAGGIITSSETWNRFTSKGRFSELSNTRWLSQWIDIAANGEFKEVTEQFFFHKQKRQRVYGSITSDSVKDMKWIIEGDYDGRFLRLFWQPDPSSSRRYFVDYGCYFFERQGDGTFKGYGTGYDSEHNKVIHGKNTLIPLP